MPTPKRQHEPGLIDQLFTAPHRFEFFQAVRLLERWLAPDTGAGRELLPGKIRFRNSISLAFPASEIEQLQVLPAEAATASARAQLEHIEITPAFMGMLGLSGTLPAIYTEQIAARELYRKDFAARAFLDVFTHRALALFYAAWKKHRLHLQYEADRNQRFAPLALALVGMGHASLNARLGAEQGGVADESLAFFAGTLQQRHVSALQLQRLLTRYLQTPVRIEQFCGRWYTLPAAARTSLGLAGGVLGRNALSGERVWQRDLRVRVHVGPLDAARLGRFLPGGPGARALRELLTLFSGVSLEYEVNLHLKAEAVRSCALDSQRSPTSGRLGWDTYVQSRPARDDRCDVRYDLHPEMA